jgi:DNA-directed RNA polymerase specialized sigma24 family protein
MKDIAAFDAFYADARGRLLHQTYALTGDLPVAQASVRDAFVAAWHHWRKVSQLEDPESWVRPLAWTHASRRNTARLWARQRTSNPEATATLDALGRLTPTQRKVLLLAQLTTGSLEEVAREAELPLSAAEDQLQSATANFASHRGIDSALIRAVLDPLADQVADVSWPRPAVIRRAGGARRRNHALVGVAAVAGLLVIS